MINLSISTAYKKYLPKALFFNAVNATLKFESVDAEKTDLSILVRNDAFIRKYKKEYFGIDEPTDVLSFPAGDVSPESNQVYLGDIMISYPQAESNALAAHKTPQQEMMLLVVHGVLHLLGYDHADDETQKIMWQKQETILNSLSE